MGMEGGRARGPGGLEHVEEFSMGKKKELVVMVANSAREEGILFVLSSRDRHWHVPVHTRHGWG